MELSVLIFSLGLLLAGVWLIFTISGDFKEKSRQVQRIPDAPRRSPRIKRRASSGVQWQVETSARQRPLAPQVNAPNAATIKSGQTEIADPWQSLNAALLRELFEKFTRDS